MAAGELRPANNTAESCVRRGRQTRPLAESEPLLLPAERPRGGSGADMTEDTSVGTGGVGTVPLVAAPSEPAICRSHRNCCCKDVEIVNKALALFPAEPP